MPTPAWEPAFPGSGGCFHRRVLTKENIGPRTVGSTKLLPAPSSSHRRGPAPLLPPPSWAMPGGFPSTACLFWHRRAPAAGQLPGVLRDAFLHLGGSHHANQRWQDPSGKLSHTSWKRVKGGKATAASSGERGCAGRGPRAASQRAARRCPPGRPRRPGPALRNRSRLGRAAGEA